MTRIDISRRHALIAGMAAAMASGARARPGPPQEVATLLPGARLVGQGRLRWLGLTVYDARLWSPAPAGEDLLLQPFGLELEYARAFKGEKIAERSIAEMARIGSFAPDQAQQWLDTMKRVFPDVGPGDRITGVQRSGQEALFFHNGTPRGTLSDAEFTRLFFGIWLSPRTSAPQLREQLLGLRAEAPR
jgi:hypothetical protein